MIFHSVISRCTAKLITLVVIATCQTCCFSSFLQLPSSYLPLVWLLDRVRAAAKISAESVGSPYNQLYSVSYPSSSTNYSSEDI